jgi:hypothetical protein
MAVELRCPKCKTKLRLNMEVGPDMDIGCPECGHVFEVEENMVGAGAKASKKAKKGEAEIDEDEDEKKPEKKPAAAEPKKPKKRKAKKRKTNPKVMIAIITGVVLVVGTVAGVLIWFFTKKSSFESMMTYLPDDCQTVFGLNIGHAQKYPMFYETCQTQFANTGFKEAGDVMAKALGSQKMDDVTDRLIQGVGSSGGVRVEATVFRTKEEFDQTLLSKIPGAQKYTAEGVDYYTIPPLPRLGYPAPRVFAPTNRLVVFCSGAIPETKFRAMLTGNKDNLDNTAYVKSGRLGKQTIRGTLWQFMINDDAPRLSPHRRQPIFAQGAGGDNEEAKEFAVDMGTLSSAAKGMGLKLSVGSREVKGEWLIQYGDSDAASNMYKKWRDKEWVKDDEKNPPRYWKTLGNISGIGKTAENVLRDGLYFKSSGELFIAGTSVETTLFSVSSVINTFAGQPGGGGTPGGGMGPPPGGGGMGPPPGGGGALPGPGGGIIMP